MQQYVGLWQLVIHVIGIKIVFGLNGIL